MMRRLFFLVILLSISLAVSATEKLSEPTITISPDIYYPFDEVLYIEGRAVPSSTVEIQFQKQGAKPLRFNMKSDQNGEWVLAEKIPLEEGEWEIRARVSVGGGRSDEVSEWSNPRIFKVIASGITIGGVNIKFAALSFIILALLVFGGGALFFMYLRVRRLNSALVSKEVREARESVRDGFSELRKDLLDELRLLNESPGPHSPEMLTRKEHILRELDTLEKNMEKEIGDIERHSV